MPTKFMHIYIAIKLQENSSVNTWMMLVTCFTAQPTRVEINTKRVRGPCFRTPLHVC